MLNFHRDLHTKQHLIAIARGSPRKSIVGNIIVNAEMMGTHRWPLCVLMKSQSNRSHVEIKTITANSMAQQQHFDDVECVRAQIIIDMKNCEQTNSYAIVYASMGIVSEAEIVLR